MGRSQSAGRLGPSGPHRAPIGPTRGAPRSRKLRANGRRFRVRRVARDRHAGSQENEGGSMSTTYKPGDIDAVLRDGSSVRMRASHPTDESAIAVFLAGLSEESRRLRFGTGTVDLQATARHWSGTEIG